MTRQTEALAVSAAGNEPASTAAALGMRVLQARITYWLLAFLVALATSEVKPFTSNQETYWARALAATTAGGVLNADWFVRTRDPVPVFTLLATPLTAFGPWAMWLANAALGALLLVFMAQIARGNAARAREPVLAWVSFFGLSWLALPGLIRSCIFEGVAGQRAYTEYLQPSNLGVLFVAGVWLAFEGRSTAAVLLCAAAAWIHPTYALSCVLFTLGVAFADLRLAKRRGLITLLLGLAAVAPPALASARVFAPTSRAVALRAAQLLTAERMPHHALFSSWGQPEALLKLGLIVLTIALATGRSRTLLLCWASITALLTALVVLAHQPQLLLLFPWRSTVWLMPACAALLLGWAVRASLGQRSRWLLVCMAPLLIVCGYRLVRGDSGNGPDRDPGVPLAEKIRWSERERWTLLIPVDWEAVRLNAPAAVYVDFKSHPYKDNEVLAWWERVSRARAVFPKDRELNCDALDSVLGSDPRVGFVLAPRAIGLAHCSLLLAADNDSEAVLYRVRGRTSSE